MKARETISPEVWAHVLVDLKQQEGFRSTAYLDTVGVWTIGYGFTEDVRPGDTITRQEAEIYLGERVDIAIKDARALVGEEFDALDGPRQAIMINLAFNLGYRRLSKFVATLAAVRAGNFKQAAIQLTNSKWCGQVKTRCTALTGSMRSGLYLHAI